ncbi:hypothetical protein [Chryseobacterium sp. Leaf394]|uniref:hypothetical protein n=1 Tax=Chryseobacterium sp. Leaf394 TaxID=1736361 RepID=UPI000FF88C14|nr:hypothetical protein [Chryseobacterium sp. Leaf394]
METIEFKDKREQDRIRLNFYSYPYDNILIESNQISDKILINKMYKNPFYIAELQASNCQVELLVNDLPCFNQYTQNFPSQIVIKDLA